MEFEAGITSFYSDPAPLKILDFPAVKSCVSHPSLPH